MSRLIVCADLRNSAERRHISMTDDIASQLERRLGRVHARQRLGIEIEDNEKGVFLLRVQLSGNRQALRTREGKSQR